MKRGSAEARRLGPDPAAVTGDDGLADRKADAHPLRLGAEKGLEQPLDDVRRQARAAVLDADANACPLARKGADPKPEDRAVGYRVDLVADQIEYDLLDLDAVDDHPLGRGVQPHLHFDAALAGADQGKRTRLVDDALQAFDAVL